MREYFKINAANNLPSKKSSGTESIFVVNTDAKDRALAGAGEY